MKRFFTCIAVATLIGGCFTACDDCSTVNGYVVGKTHQAAHTYVRYDAVLHVNTIHHYPEQWILFVADSIRVRNCAVTQDTYLAAHHGQKIRLKLDTNGKEAENK
jgi:hypothetical protein